MFKTSITKVERNRILTKGYRQNELIGRVPYGSVVYLLLKGELPSEEEGKMMDALLVSSVDHGPMAPSALAARSIASAGVPLPTAVAGGVAAVGDFHGGAIENCMKILFDLSRSLDEGEALEDLCRGYVKDLLEKGQRMPGLGHRIHTEDPRAKRLFELARELKVAGKHVRILSTIQYLFTEEGRKLPINVDGAIAAIACDMRFDYRLGKVFFLLGRVAGLVAHVHEEMTRERPMRMMVVEEPIYDGPEERDLHT